MAARSRMSRSHCYGGVGRIASVRSGSCPMHSAEPETQSGRVRLLGPVDVLGASGAISVGGARPRAVLGMLAIADGQQLSVDAIVDGVWGDAPPVNVRNGLQVCVSGIRKALAVAFDSPATAWSLVVAGRGYRLQLPDDAVDAAVFSAAVKRADEALDAGRYSDVASLLENALGLWVGEALSGVGDAPFAKVEGQRLAEQQLVARELWADAMLQLGRPADVC